MKDNKPQAENEEGNLNRNSNSAYSGSGGMQPSGREAETGRLNDYPEEGIDDTSVDNKNKDQDNKNNNTGGKSIAEATDPSKLSKI